MYHHRPTASRDTTFGDKLPTCRVDSLEMVVGSVGEYRPTGSASWDECVERLEIYCAANKLTTNEEKRVVLLGCYGEETYSLFVTLVKPARPTATNFKSVVQAAKGHLHPTPLELYAMFLLPLNVLIRDRFVCGISNGAVQQQLLAVHELSFETAYDLLSQHRQ